MKNIDAFKKAIETVDFAIHGGILVFLIIRLMEDFTHKTIIPLSIFYIWVFVYHFIYYKIAYK